MFMKKLSFKLPNIQRKYFLQKLAFGSRVVTLQPYEAWRQEQRNGDIKCYKQWNVTRECFRRKKNDVINLKGDLLKYKWEVSLLVSITGKILDWQNYPNIDWQYQSSFRKEKLLFSDKKIIMKSYLCQSSV